MYQQALTIKPGDAYATNRIEEATRLEQAKSVDEVEIQYQKILAAGQKKFDAGDYTGALDMYKRALAIRPADPVPQKRIDEINQILQSKTSNTEFDKFIKDADAYFKSGNLALAKENYLKALDIKEDAYARSQLAEIERIMRDESVDQVNEQYNKIIAKADELFSATEYEKALGYYKRALTIKKTDAHAIARVDEIDRLLHPENYINESADLRNPGTLVNETDVDMEAMLLEADEQREFLTTEKVVDQRESAEDENTENATVQTDENFETEDQATEISIDVEDQAWAADEKRTEANLEVIEMEYALTEEERERSTTNENDVQLQNQVVTNLNIEIENRDEGNDLPREEYIADVERIKIEVADEETDNSNTNENGMYEQKDYVTTVQEEHITNDPNNDIDRTNGEVYVEDMNVLLINENTQNAWDQEDEVMAVKDNTEVLIDERISNDVGNDIPREEGIVDLNDYTLDKEEVDRNNANDQIDANMDQKTYGENLSIEIEENNLGNDLPRQNMEEFVVNAEIEIEDNIQDWSGDQVNNNGNTNETVSNFEIELEEDRVENDKERQDYEEEVVVINDDINDHQSNLSELNEDNSYDTEDHTDGMMDTKTEFDINANDKATANADNTNLAVEDLIEDNKIISETNSEVTQGTEDYIDEMKNADPNPENVTTPNELGQKYPEGVTEEVYAINDENGLLESYVVRRIVVIDGTGYVYEKTQTKFGGVTYTRDGQAIADYQWTDETENANLTRN